MVQRLHHRGPDSSGHWQAEHGGPLLGHARLAIVDLSVHGHQPMHCAEGRYTLCYNGEIYNHLELRQALAPQVWRGHSDTETLLAGITRWGVERTLQQAVGMFAIALWDAQERCLWLARDRLGEKPLYLARCNGGIAFASELKALLPVPGINLDVDPQAVDLYLQLGTVPAPLSIYQGICKLMPGELMRLDAPGAEPSRQRYWQLPLDTTGIDTSEDDAALTEFERLLLQSITGQRLADVPLGTFLSGGVDSSLITALLQRCSDRPVRSFSIGFAGSEHDESAQAAAVARHLGTEHTELQVSADDALALVPRLAGIWDEPFADASQIPTLLLSRLTREHVTVALSGDAGDELFGGYRRYHKAPDARAFHEELVRKLEALHQFDCLRANKAMMAWGVEPRVPFLDREFLDVAMRMDAARKMVRQGDDGPQRMEKGVLRAAFDGYLPPEILWRQKEQFSDGVGYGWIDGLKAHAEAQVSDRVLAAADKRFPANPPQTKEAYWYRHLFEQFYPSRAAADTVPGGKSIACSSPAAIAWDAAFATMADPSGRAVAGVHHDALGAG